ncbi:glycosyltransferase 87 family protein [Rhodococcus sp. NPDC127528]|uniref:glycosyltransferase 87 family protein n=1 Tax=unclassified Rhodococcus (in: high G+C Gram-positive bacteria) TaxID=192944 RepID=UPI00363D1145
MSAPPRTVPVAGRSLPSTPWLVGTLAALAAAVVLAHDRVVPLAAPLWGLFRNGLDLLVYRSGGATVLTGAGLYDHALHGGMWYTYPPFSAILFAPLRALSPDLTSLLGYLANFAFLYLVVLLCWRRLGYRPDRTLYVVSALLTVIFSWLEPVRTTIWLGQINLLLMLIVLWDLGRPEGSRLRGFAVGLAAGIKLTPALFIVQLVVTRQWRAAATATATLAATVAVGFVVLFSDSWAYWTVTLRQSTRIGETAWPANQSAAGVIARLLHEAEPPRLLWLAVAAALTVLGMTAVHLAHRRGQDLLATTMCGLTSCAVSPFSWGHHWVWFVPLIVLALDRALRSSRVLSFALPVALAAPLLCWAHRFPDGVWAIGLFMVPAPAALAPVFEAAYPLLFVVTAVTVVGTLARRGGSEPEVSPQLACDLPHITTRSREGLGPTPVA